MVIDFLSVNYANIYLSTILLYIFILNKKNIYYILIIDLILNGVPFITLIILILYYLNKNIFNILNDSFLNKYLLLVLYYFLFGIILYSIFNKFNMYIINHLFNNLIYNLIYYYIGLKIIDKRKNIDE